MFRNNFLFSFLFSFGYLRKHLCTHFIHFRGGQAFTVNSAILLLAISFLFYKGELLYILKKNNFLQLFLQLHTLDSRRLPEKLYFKSHTLAHTNTITRTVRFAAGSPNIWHLWQPTIWTVDELWRMISHESLYNSH